MLDRADRRRSPATWAPTAVAVVVVLGLAFGALAAGSPVPNSGASDPSAVAPSVAGDADDSNASALGALVAIYPNPVADGDRGEYVVVDLRYPLNWTMTDGETTVEFPFGVAGTFALSASQSATRERVDVPVVRAPALSLANGGEELTLRADGGAVDALAYESAPEGEVLSESGCRPVGYEPRPPRSFGAGNATAFVLPDAPAAATDPLTNATDRLYLAG